MRHLALEFIDRSLVTATNDDSRERAEVECDKFVTLAQLRAHRITNEGEREEGRKKERVL